MTEATTEISKDDIIRRLNLGGLVRDWGGFEKLVAELNSTGDVTVDHDVKLVGKSGAPRQIDVLIRHKQGLIEHLVAIDCKHWKVRVSRAEVDALANTVREVNASRGVLFSVLGFESGAITQAKADGIELFTVRELTDEEWGLPGRHIDFYLHIDSFSVRNFQSPGAWGYNLTSAVNFNLQFGQAGPESSTPIQTWEGSNAKTLEQLVEGLVNRAKNDVWKPHILFDGKNGVRKFWKAIRVDLKPPVVVPSGTGYVAIPTVTFDLGFTINQSRFQFDRGAKYAFALAVQDEVRGVVNAASRESDDNATTLLELEKREHKDGLVLVNGSVMTVEIRGLHDFPEFDTLPKGEFLDKIDPLPATSIAS